MIQRCLASFTNSRCEVSAGSVENQYLAGSRSPLGHSINSHSSGWGSLLLKSRCAGRTRVAAKRERSFVLLPSRHVTVFHSWDGNDSASCFTETGWWFLSRRKHFAGRLLPGLAGSGAFPEGQTVVGPRTPTV